MSEPQRQHHDYSPSTLQSLEACPCWQGVQSETPHPRTVIGTVSHGVIETGEDNPRLSDEDAGHIASCIDFYDQRKALMQAARRHVVTHSTAALWGKDLGPGLATYEAGENAEKLISPIIELKETYLPVDDLLFEGTDATTAGYIDCALINHDRTYAELFDWKFGLWPVESANNNLQGIAYALGLIKKYKTLKSVRYFFKQPNLDYVTEAVIRREDAPAHYLRIQVVVAKARAARAAGDFKTAKAYIPACNFCAHIGICPVVTEFACKVGSKFFPVEIPSDITPSMVHNPVDTKLGLRLAQVLEVWSGAFKRIIADRVIRRDCEPPEGYIVDSRQPREIKDATKYREVALRYLTESEYAATLKASFGKVEQLISDKAPRGQKKAAVLQFAEEIEACGAVAKGDGYTFLRAVPTKPAS